MSFDLFLNHCPLPSWQTTLDCMPNERVRTGGRLLEKAPPGASRGLSVQLRLIWLCVGWRGHAATLFPNGAYAFVRQLL